MRMWGTSSRGFHRGRRHKNRADKIKTERRGWQHSLVPSPAQPSRQTNPTCQPTHFSHVLLTTNKLLTQPNVMFCHTKRINRPQKKRKGRKKPRTHSLTSVTHGGGSPQKTVHVEARTTEAASRAPFVPNPPKICPKLQALAPVGREGAQANLRK